MRTMRESGAATEQPSPARSDMPEQGQQFYGKPITADDVASFDEVAREVEAENAARSDMLDAERVKPWRHRLPRPFGDCTGSEIYEAKEAELDDWRKLFAAQGTQPERQSVDDLRLDLGLTNLALDQVREKLAQADAYIERLSAESAPSGETIDGPEFRALFRGLIGPDGDVWAPMVEFINAWGAQQSKAGRSTAGTTAARNREADRARFPDPGFNRWLDEGISDAGHTVWDTIVDTCSAWHAWNERQFHVGATAGNAAPTEAASDCEHCGTRRPLHLLTCPVAEKGMAEGKKKEAPVPLRQLLIDLSNNTYFCGLHLDDDTKYAAYLQEAEKAEQGLIELFERATAGNAAPTELAALLARIDAAAEGICFERYGSETGEPSFDRDAAILEIIDLRHGYAVASEPDTYEDSPVAGSAIPTGISAYRGSDGSTQSSYRASNAATAAPGDLDSAIRRALCGYTVGDGGKLDYEDCVKVLVREILASNAGAAPADAVIEAARKLVKAKGRYHTEQNYKALMAEVAEYDALAAALAKLDNSPVGAKEKE